MKHPSKLALPPDLQPQSKGSKMRRIFAGLAVASFMTLGAAGAAHAQMSYTCDEGSNPPSGTITGDAVITQSGSCTLSNGVNATGSISISADGAIDVQSSLSAGSGLTISGGSSVTTQDISASGNVSITGSDAINIDGVLNNSGSDGSAPVTINGSSTVDTTDIFASGTIQIIGADTITVDGGITNTGYTIVVSSQTEVSLQNIFDSGGTFGEVRIFSNGSDPLTIGEGGDSNGVGSIDISSSSSVGYAYFSNAGSGGITFQNGTINVNNSGGVAGSIVLDVRSGSGPITLDGGTVNVDGSGSNESGAITVLANSEAGVSVTDDTTLTSSQSASVVTPGTDHFVTFATNQINMSANLNVNVNGNGVSDSSGVVASILPAGTITFTATDDPSTPIVPNGNNSSWAGSSESITGEGTLTVSVNGNTAPVRIAGDSLTMTAPVTILNYGSGDSVSILSTDGAGNNNSMTIGSLNVYLQTQAAGQTPGNIYLTASQISSVTNSVLLDADGANGGNGSVVNVSVASGTLPLGNSSNEIQISSGADSGGGDGGIINIYGNSATTTIDQSSLNANASGGDGEGGTIDVNSASIATTSNATIFATGHGAGDGGTITLNSTGDGTTLSIAGGDNSLALVAQGGDTGNGGTVNLLAPTVDLDGGSVFVNAQSDGDGGNINVDNTGTLNIAVDFVMSANGAGNGDGGYITLNAGLINIADDYTPTLQANGAGSGIGGHVTFTTTDQLDLGQSSITADGGDGGMGGEVSVDTSGQDILGTATISAYGGCSDGDGGTVTVSGNNVSFASIGASSGGDPSTSSCMAIAAKPVQVQAPATRKK